MPSGQPPADGGDVPLGSWTVRCTCCVVVLYHRQIPPGACGLTELKFGQQVPRTHTCISYHIIAPVRSGIGKTKLASAHKHATTTTTKSPYVVGVCGCLCVDRMPSMTLGRSVQMHMPKYIYIYISIADALPRIRSER